METLPAVYKLGQDIRVGLKPWAFGHALRIKMAEYDSKALSDWLALHGLTVQEAMPYLDVDRPASVEAAPHPHPPSVRQDSARTSLGTIYFIRGGDMVKIGYTGGKVRTRLSSMQSGSPVRLELLHTIRGTRADEKDYHARFAAYREHGEWFRIEGDLYNYLHRKQT